VASEQNGSLSVARLHHRIELGMPTCRSVWLDLEAKILYCGIRV